MQLFDRSASNQHHYRVKSVAVDKKGKITHWRADIHRANRSDCWNVEKGNPM